MRRMKTVAIIDALAAMLYVVVGLMQPTLLGTSLWAAGAIFWLLAAMVAYKAYRQEEILTP